MIILNETQFKNKFNEGSDRVLDNTYVYLISRGLKIEGEEDNELDINSKLDMLCPPQELLDQVASGDIGKKKFKKEYFKHLNYSGNVFLLYTIIRAFNEKKYLPIFVCTDKEWESGYLQLFAKYISETFGVKFLKPKKYLQKVKELWKESKRISKKGKKRNKAFRRLMKDFVEDNVGLSMQGLSKLDKLDREFAIDRIVVLINQSDNPKEEISKKSILNSIKTYAEVGKKTNKRVKSAVKELGLKKKPERWSKDNLIELAYAIYYDVHNKDIGGGSKNVHSNTLESVTKRS